MKPFGGIIVGLLLVVSGVQGCAPSQPQTITIHARYPWNHCLGVCLDYDLSVDSSGKGVYRVRHAPDQPWSVSEFRVEPERVEAFRAKLSAIRPAGLGVRAGQCTDGDKAMRNVVPVTIEWIDRWATSRFESCATENIWSAIMPAFRELRFSFSERRVVSAQEASKRFFPF